MSNTVVDTFQNTIKTKIDDLRKFNDIGISALSGDIKWLKKSIEKLGNGSDKQGIERVEIDASRLLVTCKNEISTKIELCDIEESRMTTFKNLVENLSGSIDIFAAVITPKDTNNEMVNDEDMRKSLENIQKSADELLKFLQALLKTKRNQFDQNMGDISKNLRKRFDESEKENEDMKLKVNEATDELKNMKKKHIEDNITNLREVELWKAKANGKRIEVSSIVETAQNLLQSVEPETAKKYGIILLIVLVALFIFPSSESNHQDLRLTKIRDTVSKLATSQKSHQYLYNRDNSISFRYTIHNFSKRDHEPKYMKTLYIADLSWNVYYQWETDFLRVWMVSNWKEPSASWNCLVRTEVKVLSQFDSNKNLVEPRAFLLTALSDRIEHEFPLLNLTQPDQGIIKEDTLLMELNIWLLSYSGIPTPEFTFFNHKASPATGSLTYVFSNVSQLKEEKPMVSRMFDVGAETWQVYLEMKPQGIELQSINFWFVSCTAKWEIRVLKEPKKSPVYSETVVTRIGSGQPKFIHQNLNWERIMREGKNFMKDDSITIQVIVTSYSDF